MAVQGLRLRGCEGVLRLERGSYHKANLCGLGNAAAAPKQLQLLGF